MELVFLTFVQKGPLSTIPNFVFCIPFEHEMCMSKVVGGQRINSHFLVAFFPFFALKFSYFSFYCLYFFLCFAFFSIFSCFSDFCFLLFIFFSFWAHLGGKFLFFLSKLSLQHILILLGLVIIIPFQIINKTWLNIENFINTNSTRTFNTNTKMDKMNRAEHDGTGR